MLAEFLYAWLSTEPTITNFVGEAENARISETSAGKGEVRPYIVHHVIPGIPVGRILAHRDDKRFTRVQFDCWADTPEEANALATALELLLDPPEGTASPYTKTIGTRRVLSAQVDDRGQLFEVLAGDPTPGPGVFVDVVFHHNWP